MTEYSILAHLSSVLMQIVSIKKLPVSCSLTINSTNVFARFMEMPTNKVQDSYPNLSSTLIVY